MGRDRPTQVWLVITGNNNGARKGTSVPVQDKLCSTGSQIRKQTSPPVTETTTKKTKAAAAAQQRTEQVTVTAGFIHVKLKP